MTHVARTWRGLACVCRLAYSPAVQADRPEFGSAMWTAW